MKINKFLLIAFVVAIVFTLPFLTVKESEETVRPKPQAVTVETAPVVSRVLVEQFETLGTLTSLDSIDITSEIAGQIVSISFQPGTFVHKGTVLIQLDSSVMKSELASAKASFALSETNYKRLQQLAVKNLASGQALDKAYADLREKQNSMNVKEVQLAKLTLRAPFSGTLGSKQVSIGQYVKVGQPLVHLVANQKLRVEYNLPERLLPKIHDGQTVQISSDAFPRKIFRGKVNYIAPAVDKETRTIAVEALIDNPAYRLSEGLFVRIKHQLGHPRKRLLIPEESLIPTINGQKVFIVRQGHAYTVHVKTGAHHAAMTEIAQGLSANDTVIVRGQHKLKEGSPVVTLPTLGG